MLNILALKYKSIQLHGSSILYKKKGIVILGDGGAGKSTSTINAIQFYNANTVGDDYFLFCSKTLKVFPIYRTIKFKNNQSKTIAFLKNYKDFHLRIMQILCWHFLQIQYHFSGLQS